LHHNTRASQPTIIHNLAHKSTKNQFARHTCITNQCNNKQSRNKYEKQKERRRKKQENHLFVKKEGKTFWQIYQEKELHLKYCIFYPAIELHASPDAGSALQSIQVRCSFSVCGILMSSCHSKRSMKCSSTRPWRSSEAGLLLPYDRFFDDTPFSEIVSRRLHVKNLGSSCQLNTLNEIRPMSLK
jgi:hypothetical protein